MRNIKDKRGKLKALRNSNLSMRVDVNPGIKIGPATNMPLDKCPTYL